LAVKYIIIIIIVTLVQSWHLWLLGNDKTSWALEAWISRKNFRYQMSICFWKLWNTSNQDI